MGEWGTRWDLVQIAVLSLVAGVIIAARAVGGGGGGRPPALAAVAFLLVGLSASWAAFRATPGAA